MLCPAKMSIFFELKFEYIDECEDSEIEGKISKALSYSRISFFIELVLTRAPISSRE